MTVQTKDSIVTLLNQNLTRESSIQNLEVNFIYANKQGTKSDANFDIRFPKYMKHLKSLSLHNIADKNFTETMFDMACQRKLKFFSFSLLNENQNLPNFSEALSNFKSLQTLNLSNILYGKINHTVFLSFIKKSLNLTTLSLDAINFNDHQFKEFLEQINESKSLRTL